MRVPTRVRGGALILVGIMSVMAAATSVSAVSVRWLNPGSEDGTEAVSAPASPSAIAARLQTVVGSGLTPTVAGTGGGVKHVVVQLAAPVSDTGRAELEKQGLKLLSYLGNNCFFAAASPKVGVQSLADGGLLADVAAPKRQWKTHPGFSGGTAPDWAIVPARKAESGRTPSEAAASDGESRVAAYVLFHPDVLLSPDAEAVCRAHGATIRSRIKSINGLVIELPLAAIPALTDEDSVQWVEPPLPRLREVNDGVRHITQANAVQEEAYGLDGSGVTVLVYDGGTIWPLHTDFGNRVAVRDGSGVSSHSTHVAGTIGGSGAESNGRYRGIAPNVKIESYGFEADDSGTFLYTNPGDIEADYGEAINTHGARLANNSIGTNLAVNGYPCEYEGDYGLTSMLIDAIVGGSLGGPMRVVFANGNERSTGGCGKTYHTTAPPACAKNPIMVGAVNSNDDTMTWFSSWGPTDDGRLKPDLCAPGCQTGDDGGVTSTATERGYTTMCGTSMASPAVTGMCALLLQQWEISRPGGELPRNSTLKALLVQSAVDLGAIGPDYQTGYGSARVRDAVDLLRAGQVLEDEASQGEVRTFVVRVAPGTRSLKATLAWDDPPAAPNVAAMLVNDLDIVAVAPSGGREYYPWTLDPESPDTPAVRIQPDRMNNLEQVEVDYPTAGNWTIRVQGYSVPIGSQAFSLATSSNVVACSRTGTIGIGATKVACGSSVSVTVNDCDLNGDVGAVDHLTVGVKSNSEPTGIQVVLTETGPDSATFNGEFTVSDSPGPGELRVSDGGTITAVYRDVDDGSGKPASVSATATVDCVSPTVSGVTMSELAARRAVVTFTTSEPTQAKVRFGQDCGLLDRFITETGFRDVHQVVLDKLVPASTYRFLVEVQDQAGLRAVDGAGGECHSFATPDAPDYYTQQPLIDGAMPDHRSITFTPDGSIDFYSACWEPISALPVDPEGGTWMRAGGEVVLTDGARVLLYGVPYDRFFFSPWGAINFGGLGTDAQTFENHFTMPRISPLLGWFYPKDKGRLSYKQLSDRLVATGEGWWDAVTQRPNTFQVEMFFDGRIRLSWLEIGAYRPVIGLSRGGGVPADFAESDLRKLAGCVSDPLTVDPSGPLTSRGLQGGPFSPGCATYHLTNGSDPPADIAWSASSSAGWITVEPASGTLVSGGAADVQVCIGDAARQLAAQPTEYTGQVRFVNGDSGVARVREVRLAVMTTTPPTANSVLATTVVGSPVKVTLTAEQDGEAVPPEWLTYKLTSGPAHGQLSGIGSGHVWIYQPAADFTGTDRFTYKVDNGGQPPTGGLSNEAEVIIRVVAPPHVPGSPNPPDGAVGVAVDTANLSAGASGTSLMRSAIVAASYEYGVADRHFTEPRDKLMETGLFAEVPIVDVGRVTPRLSELRMFDSVIVWSNDQFYDPTMLGDRLADYVDGGGGVVLAVFANTYVQTFGNLLGRFAQQNYFCMDSPGETHTGSMLNGPEEWLGEVFDPFHATMAGVNRFDGGWHSFRAYSSYLAPGARFISTWSDGAPLVAVRDIGGSTRVDLGFFPVSGDVDIGCWDSTTDGGRLMGNALFHTAKRSGVATVYDVYFGTDNPPATVVARDLPSPSCPTPSPLKYGTTYYWRVVARNLAGSAESPVFRFSTPPAAQVVLTDSVPDPDDRRLRFGEVALGRTRTEQVTVCNSDPVNDLVVTGLTLDRFPQYREGFDGGTADGWLPTSPTAWRAAGGEYRACGSYSGEYLSSTYTGGNWRDMWVRFKLRRTCGTSWAAAVALRASDDFAWRGTSTGSAYMIGLSGSNMFYVGRYVAGQFTFIQPWSFTRTLKQLAGVNDVVVNVLGSRITVYFNGVAAWTGTDDALASAGRVALMGYGGEAGPDMGYMFDEVEVGPALPISGDSVTAAPSTALELGGGTPRRAPDDSPVLKNMRSAAATEAAAGDVGTSLDWTLGFHLDQIPALPMTLAPGACVTVPVSFSPQEKDGHQCGLFIESNDATGSRTSVELTGWGGKGHLVIDPLDKQVLSGSEGGLPSPGLVHYALSNGSDESLDWSVVADSAWLTAIPAGGSILPHSTIDVQVAVNEKAVALAPGTYTAVVTFHDAASVLDYPREVDLQLCGLPRTPDVPQPADGARGVAFDTALSWATGLGDPHVWQAVGQAKTGYASWDQVLANVVTVTERQTLLEFRMPLVVSHATDLYFLVGEAAVREGPFVPTQIHKVHVDGTGEQTCSSGPSRMTLEPGRFYAIGVAWGQEEIGFALEYKPCPVSRALGTVEGLLYDYAVPPVLDPLVRFADVGLCPMELSFVDGGVLTYDVYLGRSGEAPVRICADVASPVCAPPQPLDYGSRYLWQVFATNPCGRRESAQWTFDTGSCAEHPPRIDLRANRRPVLRRVHGDAGSMDFDLTTPTGQFGAPIENRDSNSSQIIVRFTRPVQGVGGLDASDVQLVSSSGTAVPITDVSIAGDELTIGLGRLADGQYTLSLPGISDIANEGCLVPDALCFVVLVGDASGDGMVDSSDYIAVRAWISQAISPTTFRYDINADGRIDVVDYLVIRSHIGNAAAGKCR